MNGVPFTRSECKNVHLILEIDALQLATTKCQMRQTAAFLYPQNSRARLMVELDLYQTPVVRKSSCFCALNGRCTSVSVIHLGSSVHLISLSFQTVGQCVTVCFCVALQYLDLLALYTEQHSSMCLATTKCRM